MGEEAYQTGIVGANFNTNHQISFWNDFGGLFWPFRQFEPWTGKDVAKAGFFPFSRVTETVEVEMPDVQVRQNIRLHNRISWTFDTPLHAQSMQKVPGQSCLSCSQVAVQFDKSLPQSRLGSQSGCKQLRLSLVFPDKAFYNGRVTNNSTHFNGSQLVSHVQAWARELGFSQIGVTGVDLSSSEAGLLDWLARGFNGDMAYMSAHGLKRARPAELVPGTLSVITARMDYLPSHSADDWQNIEFGRLARPDEGVISVYARGRDYHKVLRGRLKKLGEKIALHVGPFGHRVFTDSAPVLEAELATRSGQGWRGKHTLVLSREAGSMFFLGEIYVDLALPVSEPVSNHCGSCNACVDVCPTRAIVAPYRLDARRCISYLTIEYAGPIPPELRTLMGNRIYGCDDCQLICPWNKFAQRSALPDFDERAGMTGAKLLVLFGWTEEEFLQKTEGNPIRRIGYERWLRNLAVAMGNSLRDSEDVALVRALEKRKDHPSAIVREHVTWALEYHQ